MLWGGTNLSTTISNKANKSDLNNYLPLAGGQMSGHIYKNSDSSYLSLAGGTSYTNGASIQLFSKGNNSGKFDFNTFDGTNRCILTGQANGTLSWNGSSFICTNGYLGTSTNKWKSINGVEVTGIGHIGSNEMDQSGSTKTYTRTNPNVGHYAHYCVAPDNGWVACREHGGSGTFQVCALGSYLDSDPIIISPPLNQYQFGSIPVRKGEYYAIVSGNESASHTMRFIYNNG